MNSQESQKTVTAALVVLPETAPAGLYSMLEVLSSVGTVWEELTGKESGNVRIKVELVTENDSLRHCSLGVPVEPDANFQTALGYDFVVVPDMVITADFDPREKWPAAAEWIRSQFAAGAIVGSVCTGALLLAEAGLLDEVEATTHWGAVPIFKSLYPQVRLKPEKVLVCAGPEQRILTAGGAASWSELALYLIDLYCGRREAVHISKVFLLGDLSEGQLPFAAVTRPKAHTDATIMKCQLWIAEHFKVADPVKHVTDFSGLHPRTFKRRFRAATGFSPIEYIQALRIEEAKHLLETRDLPTEQVGAEIGYVDSASFRRLFKRITGITPASYRRRFQKIGRVIQAKTEGSSNSRGK